MLVSKPYSLIIEIKFIDPYFLSYMYHYFFHLLGKNTIALFGKKIGKSDWTLSATHRSHSGCECQHKTDSVVFQYIAQSDPMRHVHAAALSLSPEPVAKKARVGDEVCTPAATISGLPTANCINIVYNFNGANFSGATEFHK